MKLKRKLVYKGHYMHEYIRPKKVMSALKWLKQNNPLYKDVDVCDDWECQWEDGDAELWEAMTNDNKQQMDTEEQLPRTWAPRATSAQLPGNVWATFGELVGYFLGIACKR